jgi:hypothetical protein
VSRVSTGGRGNGTSSSLFIGSSGPQPVFRRDILPVPPRDRLLLLVLLVFAEFNLSSSSSSKSESCSLLISSASSPLAPSTPEEFVRMLFRDPEDIARERRESCEMKFDALRVEDFLKDLLDSL